MDIALNEQNGKRRFQKHDGKMKQQLRYSTVVIGWHLMPALPKYNKP
jgi:hypothetical protein